MFEFLNWFQTAFANAAFAKSMFIGLVLTLLAAVWIAQIVAGNARAAKIAGYNAALKAQMLERGMSVEEIERVIAAAPASTDDEDKGDEPTDPETRLLKELNDQNYDSSDVRKILAVVRNGGIGPNSEQRLQSDVDFAVRLAKAWTDADDIVAMLRDRHAAQPRGAAVSS
jgi:hypothetical protein